MRRTRILCTLGPSSDTLELIRALIDAGADAFRFNFSHGTHESHRETCARVRTAAATTGRPIAIVQDLAGPKIRIGELASPLTVSERDPLVFERGTAAGAPGRVPVSFDALFTSVSPGSRLLLDDGRVVVEVTNASADRIETRVVTGGVLTSRKGIHAPGVVMKTAGMTAKDAADLAAGIAMGVDMVAVSFVQSPGDLQRVRQAAASAGAPDLPLIAKIEKPEAVDRIEAILDESDAVMVARGDLGIEMPLETVPAAQKRIVLAARERGIPAIVATEVLESMRTAIRPTRAEVTDAAHAVDEGADAIMLAGETAVGQHPVLAVSTLDRIIVEAEKAEGTGAPAARIKPRDATHELALCEAAVALASRSGALAIVAVTESGRTARLLAALRPGARVLAATPNAATAARLALVWGVAPIITPGTSMADLRQALRTGPLVPAAASVVFVSIDAALDRENSNYVHVERL